MNFRHHGRGSTGPNGELIHAEVQIGDSVMITDEAGDGAPARSPESLGGVVSAIMAAYGRTLTSSGRAPSRLEQRWSIHWRISSTASGAVASGDPFGQHWMLSQRIEQVSREEMNGRAASFFASS